MPSRSPVNKWVITARHLSRRCVRVRVVSKVACISRFANLGQEWDGEFLLGELEPVESLEPSVVFDVVRSILEAAVALCDIGHK